MVNAKPRRGEKLCGGHASGEEFFEFILAGVGLARKKSKIFLAGAGLVSPKHTNSRQNVQIPHQNGPIPPHGEKKSKFSSPGRGLW